MTLRKVAVTVKKITVSDIAKVMHKNPQCIRVGLQQGLFPFGAAVQTRPNRFNYVFFPEKVKEYLGVDFENEETL